MIAKTSSHPVEKPNDSIIRHTLPNTTTVKHPRDQLFPYFWTIRTFPNFSAITRSFSRNENSQFVRCDKVITKNFSDAFYSSFNLIFFALLAFQSILKNKSRFYHKSGVFSHSTENETIFHFHLLFIVLNAHNEGKKVPETVILPKYFKPLKRDFFMYKQASRRNSLFN